MTDKKVVFIFGGPSAEHEVSLATAKSTLPAFEDEFLLLPVFITKDTKWVVAEDFVPASEAWSVAEKLLDQPGTIADVALESIERHDPMVVFLGLHGEFGEDGTIQSLLEARGFLYTGSDSEASALAMDKPKVLELLQNEDIMVPEFLEITSDIPESEITDFAQFHQYPLVVMPADRGSSVGVTIAHTAEELNAGLAKAREFSPRVLITKYITGMEITCGLLATSKTDLVMLPVTEIVPNESHAFFDYDAKYVAGESEDITPARITPELTEKVQHLAKKVHHLVGADGYSRVDMIIDADGTPYVLEINTLPGMTPTSLIPQEAKAAGYTFGQLLTIICTNVDRSAKDVITFSD